MEKIMKTAENLSQEELAELIVDMLHRTAVHETMWFREVEHQLGFAEACRAMEEAWTKTRRIATKRLGDILGFAQENGMPLALSSMEKDKQLQLTDAIAKNWLAQDGVWFQAVEKAHGMNDAKRCNDSTWARFSPFEAFTVKNMLGLQDKPGLAGLAQALPFRMYGRLNVQSVYFKDDALILEMNNCRVQAARKRKNLADYPCRSAGLVEYSAFASAIDARIRTACLGCPPDPHPAEWFCAWKFYIPAENEEK